ncbi:autotransporter domain-containing protein [Proteus sp. DFP240708]|uniref:autotransporter domain-containing protein n=1 Tax=Proteus sp. DFP240708 TaxID=3399624 RepID=UPI003A4D6C1C
MSLSDNGQFATGYGKTDDKENVFFIYDTQSKEIVTIDDIDNHYFTTHDGLFSLYSRDNDREKTYVPFKKRTFFIYDLNNKTKILLSELENSALKDHQEKEKFKAYQTLDFLKDNQQDEYDRDNIIEDQSPDIMGVSADGHFLYGSLDRKGNPRFPAQWKKLEKIIPSLKDGKDLRLTEKDIEEIEKTGALAYEVIKRIRLGYVYDRKKNKLNIIRKTTYGYGSSKINAFSDNNIAIGWLETMLTEKVAIDYGIDNVIGKDIKLLRKAFVYDAKLNKIITPQAFTKNENYNSEATDISRDGNIIVGWSENNKKRKNFVKEYNDENSDIESENLRNGFAYFYNKNEMISLQGLGNADNESEAHSLSRDGHSIFGVAQDGDNKWKLVAWKINNTKEDKQIIDEETLRQEEAKRQELAEKQRQEEAKRQELAEKQRQEEAKRQEQAEKQRQEEAKRLELAEKQRQEEAKRQELAEKQRQEEAKRQELAEKQRQEEAKRQELAEKQRQEEAKRQELAEKQRQEEAKRQELAEKQRQEEAKRQELAEKQRQEEAKRQELAEKQRQEEAKRQELAEKQRQEEAKRQELAEKQRQEEAKRQELAEKQRQEEAKRQEQAEAKRLEQEEKQRQENTNVEIDKNIGNTISVEDELAQRTKEKAKEKENTKPSIVISKPIDIENTYKSMQLMAENGYKLMDMQQGQLRHLASATCSVGTEKACISGFAHYQNINKANATQTGLSGAYRFDINAIPFVVGLAIDTDVYSSLPKGYQYQGYALPLIGFSLDLMPSLNAELNSNALHLSLKGAYLNRKVSIERLVLEDTEAGKGNAKISGYHIELQGYYPYSINNDLLLTPFAGLTFNQISRSAYSETQNAQFAVHYDALNAHSLLAKMGLGMDHLLGSSFILNTKAGLLWNLSHHQGDFRSHIDYLGQQDIDYSENKKQLKQRPFAHIGLTYQVDKHSSIGTKANWEMTTYRNHDMQFGINYTYRF